jgi:hypothetical protein
MLVGLLTGLCLGCTTPGAARQSSLLDQLRPFQGPTGPDVVQMDVALIERPIGEAYVNQELWELADEQVVESERRAVLEDNGLRVGQIGGMAPAGLQALLTSDLSCANPRRIQLHASNATTLTLGPRLTRCHFDLIHKNHETRVDLEQAQMVFSVLPQLVAAGKIRLQFTPMVQHGEPTLVPRPAADRSGWVLQENRPTERYDQLAWEVTLTPGEYVVIGTGFDRQETFGHQAFVRADEATPVQRLLVVRTARAGTELTDPQGEETFAGRSLPLALQAGLPAVRGKSP